MNPRNDTLLTVTSLLCILLFSLHLTDDIVRGFEPGGLKHVQGMTIMLVWLLATLLLIGRRSGYLIILLACTLAWLMPYAHLRGAGVGGALAASPGGHFFIWTLFALGVLAPCSVFLAGLGLWRLRKRGAAGA